MLPRIEADLSKGLVVEQKVTVGRRVNRASRGSGGLEEKGLPMKKNGYWISRAEDKWVRPLNSMELVNLGEQK